MGVYRKKERSAKKKIPCRKPSKVVKTKCFKRRKSKHQVINHLKNVDMSHIDNLDPPTIELVPDSSSRNSMGWLAHIKTAQLNTSEVQTEDSTDKGCAMRLPTMTDLNFETKRDFENQANKSKDASLCQNVKSSKASSQNFQNETEPRSESIDGNSEACLKEVVKNSSEDPVILENIGSLAEKTLDNSNGKTINCENCKELSSEVTRLNLLISGMQKNLDMKTNEMAGISKALEDQKVLNEDLKINLDKQIEKSELLTNQNFEEEIGNIFLVTSILDEET